MSTRPRSARPPLVLAVGGLDPSCGAGIVADARTLEAMGVMPLVVATALTVQAGRGVRRVHPVSARQVIAQLRELTVSLPVAAVKIGQVPTPACARALAAELGRLDVPVVLDPVLRASGGGELAGDAAARAIVRHLVPIADVVTVNLAEAAALTGIRARDVAAMARAAEALAEFGAGAVVVKGGHLRGAPVDVLWRKSGARHYAGRRLAATMHGTGCAFASALAASLAVGCGTEEAVQAARAHVRALLAGAVRVRGARLRTPPRR